MSSIMKAAAAALPEDPGVYRFYDVNEKIIYIGKAKNLRRRVLSYFTKNHDIARVRVMVKRISRIEHIVVNNEIDALLLENNLIKKYQPRYNVLLKDDKTFPWICIKNEPFARIFSTREVVKDGSEYYGPFTSGYMVKTLIDFLRKTYHLRTCALSLTQKNIESKKFSVCLEYQIGNCKGPCCSFQTHDEYLTAIAQIRNILKGNIGEAINFFKNKMVAAAKELNFESANEAKQKMQLLENYQSKSTVVNPNINNVDVFSLDSEGDIYYINYLKVVCGSIIQSYTLEMRKHLDESDVDLLQIAIIEIRDKFKSTSKEILVPFDTQFKVDGVTFTIPQKGDKRKLLDLSVKNANFYRLERLKMSEKANPALRIERLLEQMRLDLRLPRPPAHIECFDNSNLQGTNSVAACVVFKNGKPSKSEYRKYHVKTVEGIDDYASMFEIVTRRYSRIIDESKPLPDLIVVDGGKGQLHIAQKALNKLGLLDKVPIISIAERLEEIFVPNDPVPLYIDKNSTTLKVIQNLRNEAHRFGITFHRDMRSKRLVQSELDNIKGIGEKSKIALIKHFKTVETIKNSDISRLTEVVGKSKAEIIYCYFRKQKYNQ